MALTSMTAVLKQYKTMTTITILDAAEEHTALYDIRIGGGLRYGGDNGKAIDDD
jgi:hypothetical protein